MEILEILRKGAFGTVFSLSERGILSQYFLVGKTYGGYKQVINLKELS